MAAAGQNAELVRELKEVKGLLASQELKTELTGDIITIAQKRSQYKKSLRSY
jgi:hypothetical protein